MLNALIAAMLLHASGAATESCPGIAPPPKELPGWSSPHPLDAGRAAGKAARLKSSMAVTAHLLPTPDVQYLVQPEKPGSPVSYGGVFTFDVATPGRYRIAAGSAAWIDVVAGGRPAVSVAHGHGPVCSGVRKMVDFDLGKGRYVLQVAGSNGADLPLMVAMLPG